MGEGYDCIRIDNQTVQEEKKVGFIICIQM